MPFQSRAATGALVQAIGKLKMLPNVFYVTNVCQLKQIYSTKAQLVRERNVS